MRFACWRLAAVALIAAPGLAQAQEGAGCGGFKWPLDRERAALARADKPSIANGGALAYNVAATLALLPLSVAGLPKAPDGRRSGLRTSPGISASPRRRSRASTRSRSIHGGWVDVLDGGVAPASDRLQRHQGVRGSPQEREVRPAGPPARGPVQRRPARSNFGYRHARAIVERDRGRRSFRQSPFARARNCVGVRRRSVNGGNAGFR